MESSVSLNRIRVELGMDPISEKWHNLFLNERRLLEFVRGKFSLEKEHRLSTFFFISRVLNAKLHHPKVPQWDDQLNRMAFDMQCKFPNLIHDDISRLKVFIFRKT